MTIAKETIVVARRRRKGKGGAESTTKLMEEATMEMERRNFLKVAIASASALAGAGMLSACAPTSKAESSDLSNTGAVSSANITWDEEFDVVVLGAGGGGLSAALYAGDGGASVLVLEKASKAGGSTALSEGIIQMGGTKYQKAAGIEDTVEEHIAYTLELSGGLLDEDVLTALYNSFEGAVQRLNDLGVEYEETVATLSPLPFTRESPNFKPRTHYVVGKGGAYIDALLPAIEEQGAEVRYETPGTGLVLDENGAVIGVQADDGGKTIYIKANKGVVLATASVDQNKELARRVDPYQYYELEDPLFFVCPPETNTGDGLIMGMNAGGMLRGGEVAMSGAISSCGGSVHNVGFEAIAVNGYGRRFTAEDCQYAYNAQQVYHEKQKTKREVYVIFDEAHRASSETSPLPTEEDIKTREEAGTLFKADTIAELATAIGADPAVLENEIAFWNTCVDNGSDPAFGRTVALGKIDTAPFYAIIDGRMGCGSTKGLVIDAQCRVLNREGEPISGLYAAGTCAAGWCGEYYPGSGSGIGAALGFGRIAGMAIAGSAE